MVGLIIAKEHRVSDFRQAWIDALRGEIASLVAQVNAINEWRLAIDAHRGKVAVDRGGEGNQKVEDDVAEQYKLVHPDVLKMEKALAMIELRLNPNEKKAKPLLRKAKAVACKVRLDEAVCRKELKDVEKELLEESKKYLKGEWDRVKQGELRYKLALWVSFTIGVVGVVALVLGVAGLVMEEPAGGPPATTAEAESSLGPIVSPAEERPGNG